MKLTLQITSYIAIVIGALAILGSAAAFSSADPAAGYQLIGGVLFFAQGLLSLVYINDHQ